VPPATGRRTRENRTRYVVLGMLTLGEMTGYALRQAIAGSVGHFWQESYGQLYPTLRRLVSEGLAQATPTRGGPGRAGASYRITARGRAELARWVALPPVAAPQRNELLLKIFFAGAVAPGTTEGNLEKVAGKLRGELAALEAISEQLGGELGKHPDAPYWQLTLDFGLRALRGTLDWIDHAGGVVRALGARATSTRQAARAPPSPPRSRAAHPGGAR